jgi:hypothetical protein
MDNWTLLGQLNTIWSLAERVWKLASIPIAGGAAVTWLINLLGVPLWQAAIVGLCIMLALALTIVFSIQLSRQLSSPQDPGTALQGFSEFATRPKYGQVIEIVLVAALLASFAYVYVFSRGLTQQLAQLREQIKPRLLTGTQRDELSYAANRVPPEDLYTLRIEVIDDCADCSGLAEGLAETWAKVPRWRVQYIKNPTLSAQKLFAVSILEGIKECSIREKLMIEEVLARIQIKYTLVLDDAQSAQRDVCTIFVGRRLPG